MVASCRGSVRKVDGGTSSSYKSTKLSVRALTRSSSGKQTPSRLPLIFCFVLQSTHGSIHVYVSLQNTKLACVFINFFHWYLQQAIQVLSPILQFTFILWIQLLENLISGNHAASWLVNLSLHLSFLPC